MLHYLTAISRQRHMVGAGYLAYRGEHIERVPLSESVPFFVQGAIDLSAIADVYKPEPQLVIQAYHCYFSCILNICYVCLCHFCYTLYKYYVCL